MKPKDEDLVLSVEVPSLRGGISLLVEELFPIRSNASFPQRCILQVIQTHADVGTVPHATCMCTPTLISDARAPLSDNGPDHTTSTGTEAVSTVRTEASRLATRASQLDLCQWHQVMRAFRFHSRLARMSASKPQTLPPPFRKLPPTAIDKPAAVTSGRCGSPFCHCEYPWVMPTQLITDLCRCS